MSLQTLPVAAAITAAAILTCSFPYKPEQFVSPEWPVSPYKFPGSAAIDSFFNTQNVKITYTLLESGLVRTVYYVDFNDATPAQKKLIKPHGLEIFDADSPLISPDGTHVAYYLIAGNTMYGAYIQKLYPNAQPVTIDINGTEPHWWKNQDTTYIIYSDQYMVENINTLGRGIGHTFRRKVSLGSGDPTMGPVDTIAPYPMNGGLSEDGRFLCTGYKRAAFYDILNDTLISINGNNQVCNPSIDQDPAHTNWMMFLNFAGIQTLNNPSGFPVDGNLSDHTFLFIVDAGNTVQDYVPVSIMGSSYHAFQCPEWSNNPLYATAMALPEDASPTGDGVIIKGIGNTASPKEVLVFTQGTGKLNTQRSTPYVWIGN